MKLLLTSAGLTTKSLRTEFIKLLKKDASSVKIAFITTAANVEEDKSFIEKNLHGIQAAGIKLINRIDISEPMHTWEKDLLNADVIWINGGNTFYLLDVIRKNKLSNVLFKAVQNKLYVGVSAGSILVTPSIEIATVEPADENNVQMTDYTSLGWVDFEVSPHTPDYVPVANVEAYSKHIKRTLYAYDDSSAVLVKDSQIKIVGTGFSKVFNK